LVGLLALPTTKGQSRLTSDRWRGFPSYPVLYGGNRIRDALLTPFVGTFDASAIGLVANEVESSAGRIAVTMDFSNGAACSIVGNKLAVPDPAILLGPGTSHCLVAGNHAATVVDQGTNNLLVGR